MYYMLECFGPADQERQAIDTVPTGFAWNRGTRFQNPPTAPLEVLMDGDGIMVPMFDRGILLMRDDLVDALQKAGVDNIDCYDSVLIDPINGVRHTDYKAVNIIGMAAAADLENSEYSAPSGRALIDTDFDSVAIDEGKVPGFLLFRLAEAVNAIVLHKSVKRVIEGAGVPHLDFVPPEKWFG